MAQRMLLPALLALPMALLALTVSAQETFRIKQVFSNLDGTMQFVELTEDAGVNGQHRLAGLELTSTSHGITKRFVFRHDLPNDRTGYASIIVSTGPFHHIPVPNAIADLPARFVPTESGTVAFAGVDSFSYSYLPSDGLNALYRDGIVRKASVPTFGACYEEMTECPLRSEAYAANAIAVEYYHPARDHFFVTASAADIDALDSGRLPGWQRTHESFFVTSLPSVGATHGVCRFRIPEGAGDSHFFTASPSECEDVRVKFPEFVLEAEATFYVGPDPMNGACHGEVLGFRAAPVYRLWNGRTDTNHRYTRDVATRSAMIKGGWVSEGYGPLGVAMCVSSLTPREE